jgi:hypothetical protein
MGSIPYNTPGWGLQLTYVHLEIILLAETSYTKLVFLHPVGFAGHVLHCVASGMWNINALFSCSGGTELDSTTSALGHVTTLPQNGWFTNHSKSFIHFSYVICAFTYRIVELVFALSYIRSHVWGSIGYSGTRCGTYHSIPQRVSALIRQKILDSAVDEVSEALSVHMAPPAIWIVVVPTRVTVLVGLRNPPWS